MHQTQRKKRKPTPNPLPHRKPTDARRTTETTDSPYVGDGCFESSRASAPPLVESGRTLPSLRLPSAASACQRRRQRTEGAQHRGLRETRQCARQSRLRVPPTCGADRPVALACPRRRLERAQPLRRAPLRPRAATKEWDLRTRGTCANPTSVISNP